MNEKLIISFSTGNLYYLPFERALNIIQKAGFKYIEIAGYWNDGDWEVGQHLKGYNLQQIIEMVEKYNLIICSFHDMSGVMYNLNSNIITNDLNQFIIDKDIHIPCLVTHFPYIPTNEVDRLEKYKAEARKKYIELSNNQFVTIENMAPIDGYQVLITDPNEMLDFCNETSTYINLDIVHLIQSNQNIFKTIEILKDKIRTIHLSGYDIKNGRTSINKGDLDIYQVLNLLDLKKIYAITIETQINQNLKTDDQYIKICKTLKKQVCQIIERFDIH